MTVVLPTKNIGWSEGEADASEEVYYNGKFYYYNKNIQIRYSNMIKDGHV